MLQIALTRLFSLLYFPPYVFLIISVAILGIGIGAANAALWPARAQRLGLALGSCGAALSVVLLLVFAAAGVDLQILLFALVALPYVFFGLVIASLFSAHASASRVLYMSDLVGAGCGALLAIPLLNRFGGINTMLVAAVGFTLAGLYFSTRRDRPVIIVLFCLAGVAFVANVSRPFLSVDPTRLANEKPLVGALSQGGRILESRWDAFARSDLVDPGDGRPLRIYIDGGAASIMPSEAAQRELLADIGFFPFATERPERVFVIGPGAGLDVWFGLQSGARQITAVEVNAASVEMVKARRAHTGALYDKPEVNVVVDDGRSALRRSDGKFDLIFLSQVVTLAAERGGYALSENSIYTEEAFFEYLDHLDAGGQIALKLYDEVTLTRAVSTALAALRRRGQNDQEALRHLMAFIDNRSAPPVPLLLVGERAYSEEDSLVLGAIARDVGFTPLLLPHVLVQPPLDAVASGAKPFAAFVADSEADISPASDDRPYFFQFEKGIPTSLLESVVLAALVTVALVCVFALRLRRAWAPAQRAYPPFFALLGIGFVAIEIYAIQQTRLFLGHSTFAVTLVLVTFLVGGGAGSGLSQLFSPHVLERRPHLATASVACLAILWSLIWPALSGRFIAAEPASRAVVAVLSLLPLALCMGLPFPQALRTVGRGGGGQIALAWAVNGLMTVVGSIAAVALSISLGFSAVLCLGASAYIAATIILALLPGRARS